MDIVRAVLESPPSDRVVEAPPLEGAGYAGLYPYYAELCALTELKKKPGFGVRLHSGIGGHCLLYLNGVRLDRTQNYPVLKLCEPGASPASHGVVISVNSHYKNANWVAAEGRDFVWHGALEPGERLTLDGYKRTQAQAKAMGMLDGVQFHDHLFRDKPPGMSVQDFMYELSIATDYGARFGRDSLHARLPLDLQRMAAIVDYLNDLNEPYRQGKRVFHWRVINNNCVHPVHNALAAAGIWAPWPTGQFVGRAAFNFPVPKNEFVDLILRTNDLPIQDAQAIYKNKTARHALMETGALPTVPGALVSAKRAMQENELYDVDRLRLIFFDHPYIGLYYARFRRIFREPRYTDPQANLRYFAGIYAAALEGKNLGRLTGTVSEERAQFQKRYDDYIARQAAKVARQLECLEHSPRMFAEARP